MKASKGDVYVVCIYTYDYVDESDIMKIRVVYVKLVSKELPHIKKSDEQTLAGIYSDLSAGFALYKA